VTRDLMKRRRRFSPIDGVLALMTLVFDPGFNLTLRCFKRRAVRAGCGRLGSMATRPGSPPPIDCVWVEPGDEPVIPHSSRHYAGNRCQGLLRFFFSSALIPSMRFV